jgi:hypothetical protein
MEKLPFPSAVVAFLDPVSATVANGTGEPASSLTVPETVRVCVNANTPLSISKEKSIRNFLMGDFSFKGELQIYGFSGKAKKMLIHENFTLRVSRTKDFDLMLHKK